MAMERFRAAAVAAALAMPQTVGAAVIYNEAVNGDAAIASPPSLTLGAGTNDLVGSLTFSFNPSVPDDIDGFKLSVGLSQQITSIVFSFALAPVGAGEFSGTSWDLFSSSGFIGFVNVPIPSTGLPGFASFLPLGAGTYDLKVSSAGGSLLRDEYRIADYTISVNVTETLSPVPIPAASGLLAVSLLLLGAFRRRAA